MSQAVTCWPLIARAFVPPQTNPPDISDGPVTMEQVFFPVLVFLVNINQCSTLKLHVPPTIP